MKNTFLFLSFAMLVVVEASETESKMSYLDNGKIRLGVDLSKGGAVTYLANVETRENLINSWDWGRQIQMSFYSGPVPFAPDGVALFPMWKDLGWNPIQSGDHYKNSSKVVEHRNDGKTIFVRCIPMIWPLDNVPAECFFETSYTLNGPTVEVSARLINDRKDTTQYPARDQELPAVYTNGPWYRLVTYMGDRPFTGAEVTTLVDRNDGKGWPWFQFYSPEQWGALVNEKNEGLGIYNPSTSRMAGGFAGNKGAAGAEDDPTGYMSPIQTEILDASIDYTYRYVLIVGSLAEIRDYVYAQHKKDELPAWEFSKDRQHWHYQNTTDGGWPIHDELRVQAGPTAEMVSPHSFWRAEDAPILEIEAHFPVGAKTFQIIIEPYTPLDSRPWLAWGETDIRPKSPRLAPLVVDVKPGDSLERYHINLSQHEGYRGAMVRIRLVLPDITGAVRVSRVALRNGLPGNQ
jgi:hypothetical protein